MRCHHSKLAAPVLALLSACAGEPRVLEPRTPPAREKPPVSMPAEPPPAGLGRVLLDTTDGPMRVTMQADPSFIPPGQTQAPSRTGELCVTPCAADLPLGRYRLFMTAVQGDPRGDSDDLFVGEGLNVYRRAPGTYQTPTISNTIGPTLLLIAGGALALAGLGFSAAPGSSSATGVALVGAGAAAAGAGGIWLYDASRAVQQQGATTSWREPLR